MLPHTHGTRVSSYDATADAAILHSSVLLMFVTGYSWWYSVAGGESMIDNRLSEVLGRRRMNVSELARGAGISRSATHKLYHDQTAASSLRETTVDGHLP